MPTEGIGSVMSLLVVCSELLRRTQEAGSYYPLMVRRQSGEHPMQDAHTNK